MNLSSAKLLVLVAAVTVSALLARRATGARRLGVRRRRARHVVVRILCGLFGVGILAAVGAGTWHEVQSCYKWEGPASVKVRVPSRPAPLSVAAEDDRGALYRGRVLFHVIALEGEGPAFRPVAIDQFEVRWPGDRGRKSSMRFERAGHDVEIGVSIDGLDAPHGDRDELRVHSSHRVEYRHRYGRGTMSGTQTWRGAARLADFPVDSPVRAPLCAVALSPPVIRVVILATLANEDDPLEEIPVAKFLSTRQADISQALLPGVGRALAFRDVRRAVGKAPVPALELVMHIGVSAALLLMAGALLSQFFPRPRLALAALLPGVILYAAALDRAALAVHLAHLEDAKASLAARAAACRHAGLTFFYCPTALNHVEDVARDERADANLRALATAVAKTLRR